MTDKCHAHLTGKINKHNFRQRGIVDESPRTVLKVTVLVSIGWYGIIGPFFLRTIMAEQPGWISSIIVR